MAEMFACTGKNCPFMRDVKRCTAPHCENRTPPTNADRIRAMSDEDLATWLNCMQSNAYHHGRYQSDIKPYPNMNKGWLDWLKSPVEGGEMNDLTKDEAYAVCDMIDTSLIDMIRNDTDIDSIKWLASIIHAFEKLSAFSGYVGLTYPDGRADDGGGD